MPSRSRSTTRTGPPPGLAPVQPHDQGPEAHRLQPAFQAGDHPTAGHLSGSVVQTPRPDQLSKVRGQAAQAVPGARMRGRTGGQGEERLSLGDGDVSEEVARIASGTWRSTKRSSVPRYWLRLGTRGWAAAAGR